MISVIFEVYDFCRNTVEDHARRECLQPAQGHRQAPLQAGASVQCFFFRKKGRKATFICIFLPRPGSPNRESIRLAASKMHFLATLRICQTLQMRTAKSRVYWTYCYCTYAIAPNEICFISDPTAWNILLYCQTV